MALLITERDVRTILREPDATASAIEAMREVFLEQAAGRLALLPRIQVNNPHDHPDEAVSRTTVGRTLRLMPCIAPGLGVGCVRLYTTTDLNGSVSTPCEMLLLIDSETMQLQALIEDHSLHTLRTAAPTGLATRLLARTESQRVAVIGTGRHARGQLVAVASVRPLSRTQVFGRDAHRAQHFCREMEAILGTSVTSCATPEEAIRGADIIILAAATSRPVIRGSWLEPGMHVNSISPCELDEETVTRARVFPSYTRQLLEGTPRWTPIPEMLSAGRLRPDDLTTELCNVVAGDHVGRAQSDDITLFLSCGMAGWDAAIARWVLGRARQLGLGEELWDTSTGRSIAGLVSPTPSSIL